ncbi:type IV toxin-antitoxin system AbiEi family antitoxin domain-containing protein [Nocardioides sp. KIGAM211]|uniref:Type IV toxin-antitoxin system AbiEi family antitoxin domain-containing protein n=1 Tax=Nocardioides luti TaxID=2761101 RepID=A0A7X0VC96_9ACTN|nr:type IV toxin-antitoxin system AbiEi family antitoxin domain-containing protein [Nocardioides luti]MBB6629265.1 type IV toxin-antitoxin system AbiEi family antitoxin domain-containing protein [Nocardioides luti]
MDIIDVLCEDRGFFTRAEARSAGYSDTQIASAARSGHWHRFRRGYYCLGSRWRSLSEEQQHAVRARAVMDALGPGVVALSHVSASIVHGLDIWGIPLDKVHVTRLDGGAGRIEGDVVHHEGRAIEDDIVEIDGMLVMAAPRAAIEAVGRSSSEVALCHFDSLLRRELCNADELAEQFKTMQFWPFTQHLHVPVRLADKRTGSIGESRGVNFFFHNSFPAPEPQFAVYSADGRLIGTCDWVWKKHRLLGEFDGKLKYGRLLKDGQEPGPVVFAEKQREDLLREVTDMRMIRIVWSDFERPRLLRARFERLLRRAG